MIETIIAKSKSLVSLRYNVIDESKFIKQLFSIQSPSGMEAGLRSFIIQHIKGIKNVAYTVDETGNLLITKGLLNKDEYYPCLVAHMDGIFSIKKDYKVHIIKDSGKNILYATCNDKVRSKYNNQTYSYGNTGVYGDDKCGIWIALKMLSKSDKLKVVFTVKEEIGGIGASGVDMKFFKDVGYIIEGDRRGNKDIIQHISCDTCSDEFDREISDIYTKYGMESTWGMYTDIDSFLDNDVNVSCINVSVGYYNPHSDSEYVVLEDMFRSAQMIEEMVNKLKLNKYEHIPVNNINQGYNSYYKGLDYGHGYDDFESDYTYLGSGCKCSESMSHFDPSCNICNPVDTRFSGEICKCGEELVERVYSFNCEFCQKVYIKF